MVQPVAVLLGLEHLGYHVVPGRAPLALEQALQVAVEVAQHAAPPLSFAGYIGRRHERGTLPA
jgi:hypothetical protein